jgi:hypothetical protein
VKTTGIDCSLQKRIPEGMYLGYWGGYEVVVNHGGEKWVISTKDGIRGCDMPVSVLVTEEVISIVRVKSEEDALSLGGLEDSELTYSVSFTDNFRDEGE